MYNATRVPNTFIYGYTRIYCIVKYLSQLLKGLSSSACLESFNFLGKLCLTVITCWLVIVSIYLQLTVSVIKLYGSMIRVIFSV